MEYTKRLIDLNGEVRLGSRVGNYEHAGKELEQMYSEWSKCILNINLG